VSIRKSGLRSTLETYTRSRTATEQRNRGDQKRSRVHGEIFTESAERSRIVKHGSAGRAREQIRSSRTRHNEPDHRFNMVARSIAKGDTSMRWYLWSRFLQLRKIKSNLGLPIVCLHTKYVGKYHQHKIKNIRFAILQETLYQDPLASCHHNSFPIKITTTHSNSTHFPQNPINSTRELQFGTHKHEGPQRTQYPPFRSFTTS